MNTKKYVAVNVIAKLIEWVPILTYCCLNIEYFYSTEDKGITFTTIFLLGAILMYFKDTFKNWLAKPSTFKYICISWILSLVMVVFGNQIFYVASILLVSFLAAIPLEVWKTKIKLTDEDVKKFEELKNLLQGKTK